MFYSNKFIYIWCSLVAVVVGGLYVPDMLSFYGGVVVASLLIAAVYLLAFKKPAQSTNTQQDTHYTVARAKDKNYMHNIQKMSENMDDKEDVVIFGRGYMERYHNVSGK